MLISCYMAVGDIEEAANDAARRTLAVAEKVVLRSPRTAT